MSRSSKIITGCMVLLLLLMTSTQPARLPPLVLAVPFVLIGVVLVLALYGAFRWRGVLAGKSIRLSLTVASLPMLVLVLQVLGQLTFRDLFTILAIFAIAYFYLSRITRPSSG